MKLANWIDVFLIVCALLLPQTKSYGQGVTTGSITGTVRDSQGMLVPGVRINAVHQPSGTAYQGLTLEDGRFFIPAMRVGGPYKVTASLPGFNIETVNAVEVSLGAATTVEFKLNVANVQQEVTVEAESPDPIMTPDSTGAATAITRDNLATLPSITGRFDSVARLTPQYSGTMNFSGQDSRMNNITVDGSYFNNSFGLGNTLGDRTSVAAISLAAVEQVQVAVAPYDVRQGNFVGANVNTVTRSGTNEFRGSVYHSFRNEKWVGKTAQGLAFNPGTFTFDETGFWASGPVVPNKVFFFGNYESENTTQPGTTFVANTGNQTVGGNVTRVLGSDLDALRSYLQSNFNYTTGPYQGYSNLTPGKRFLIKGDYNLNEHNKVAFRYTKLDSNTDVLLSNSNSLGFGSRRSNTTGLNFKNSNYQILENINSYVGNWNSFIGSKVTNQLIVAYDNHNESRPQHGNLFPFVDILQAGSVYTSFGYEPFTPDNTLLYHQFQIQDNFTRYLNRHVLAFGATFEHYDSDNIFFPGAQSVYVYNSLADFYTDANGFLANPGKTVAPVTLNHFQVRWNNIPGQTKPIQPLKVNYDGAFLQDQWKAGENWSVTAGIRFDIPVFARTGYDNGAADQLTFTDENNRPIQYNTGKLPNASLLWSPRVGFNWNALGRRNLQIRGGTGIFTGPPAYVWISNQVGNTGVLTGFADVTNTTAFPWNPNSDAYKPTTVTGAAPPSYELAVTDPNFKFPQIWRTNIGADHRLPLGFIGTTDLIYNRDVNGIYYINANQRLPNHSFAGSDGRPYWGTATVLGGAANQRIYQQVTDNTVLKNESIGYSWNLAFSAQRNINRFFIKAAYSYGRAKNTVDAGSIAFGSWSANPIVANGNNAPVAFSSASPGQRFFLAASYRKEYFKFGATTVATIFEGNQTNTSYLFSGDANGDGNSSNDLIYIPRDTTEMNFQPYTVGTGASAVTFSAADQAAAWDSYTKADHYLSRHRGQYAVRNATFLPMAWRDDLNISQNFLFNAGGRRHGFQLRLDILNFTNALNHNWGVSQRLVSTSPLTNPAIDAQGRLSYRLRQFNNQLLGTSPSTMPYQYNAGTADVYKVLVSLNFSFNTIGFLQ
jgi:hypothetical protein